MKHFEIVMRIFIHQSKHGRQQTISNTIEIKELLLRQKKQHSKLTSNLATRLAHNTLGKSKVGLLLIFILILLKAVRNVVLCSHLAVLLEMKSEPVFHRYISESFIKNQISLLQTEYDRVTAVDAGDRTAGVTSLEVSAVCFRQSLD